MSMKMPQFGPVQLTEDVTDKIELTEAHIVRVTKRRGEERQALTGADCAVRSAVLVSCSCGGLVVV